MVGRHPSAQLITYDSDCFLIDCGEGTQFRLLAQKARFGKLKAIFISHLHGDHYFGLIGLLSSLNLAGRTDELYLFGPRGLDELLILHFRLAKTPLHYQLHFTPTDPNVPAQIFENNHITVSTFPLEHRIPCTGFLLQEKARQRHLLREQLPDDIPFEYLRMLKNGQDIIDDNGAVLYAAEVYTTLPPPTRSYAYCSDTRFDPQLPAYIQGVNLLYHEATFGDELAQQATERYHATARQAAIIAQKASVGQLLIGHFSSRYRDFDALLQQARSEFENTLIAEEGKTFDVEG